jgi:hypothetical protein
MQADPNVDHVGLDYMRTEPGYELTDQFARDMPVALPPGWEAMDRKARWQYVAARVEPPGCYEHADFYDAWNWYRAHLGAEIVSEIIRTSGLKKPAWVFCLTWRRGIQHGQDPLMFADAGVTMLAPMLYQIERERFDRFVLSDWSKELRPGQVSLVCGDQVDNHWHQNLGPAELYRRMMAAHQQFIRGGRTEGAFWHDVSRVAQKGDLGPYPATEWALAGGAAFSKVRETWHTYPLRVSLQVLTRDCVVGAPLQMRLTIDNTCGKAVSGIKVSPAPTAGTETGPQGPTIGTLGVRQSISQDFTGRVVASDPARANRFMFAFRVTWPRRDYGEGFRSDLPAVIIAMQYVQARTSL